MSQVQLSKTERRRLRREQKQRELAKQKRLNNLRRLGKRLIWLAILVVVIFGLKLFIANREILPPTTMQGHIEQSPQSHILTEPMNVSIHKHMLEHADGKGPPGVIINYNCEDFLCASDFISKLTDLVNQYPANVYLAPYKNMSAKLVLSRLNKQEILEEFDEEKIKSFINE